VNPVKLMGFIFSQKQNFRSHFSVKLHLIIKSYAKYSVLCAVWVITTTTGLISENPALIAVDLEAGNEILDDFYS